MLFLFVGGLHGALFIGEVVISVVIIAALLDVAFRSDAQFVAASKQTKLWWVMALVLCLVVGFIGIVGGLAYFIDVRPALVATGGGSSR